jgi:hypothetical protein
VDGGYRIYTQKVTGSSPVSPTNTAHYGTLALTLYVPIRVVRPPSLEGG